LTDPEVASPPAWTIAAAGDPKGQSEENLQRIRPAVRRPPIERAYEWRAVVSIAVVTEKRVTVYEFLEMGFDVTPAAVTIMGVNITPASTSTAIGQLRQARLILRRHLNILEGTVGVH